MISFLKMIKIDLLFFAIMMAVVCFGMTLDIVYHNASIFTLVQTVITMIGIMAVYTLTKYYNLGRPVTDIKSGNYKFKFIKYDNDKIDFLFEDSEWRYGKIPLKKISIHDILVQDAGILIIEKKNCHLF